MTDIEDMELTKIYDELITQLEYQRDNIGRNTGSSAWTEAEKDRLDKVIGLLNQSYDLYKKRVKIDVRYY